VLVDIQLFEQWSGVADSSFFIFEISLRTYLFRTSPFPSGAPIAAVFSLALALEFSVSYFLIVGPDNPHDPLHFSVATLADFGSFLTRGFLLNLPSIVTGFGCSAYVGWFDADFHCDSPVSDHVASG